jgi:lipid-A-disaccharide synthase
MAKSILISAGDLSGDVHCAMLVREIARRHPDWKISAIGGTHLREAGAEIIADSSDCGVMGIGPALAVLPRVSKLRRQAVHFIENEPLDAAILCDWGAFNGRLLATLKARGVPVLYYFPPRSWRKKGPGAADLAAFVRVVATPFPWDAERLNAAWQELPTSAEWVGHPLLEIAASRLPREQLRQEFGVGAHEKLVALLPGSRVLELKYIAPQLAAAVRLWQRNETQQCEGTQQSERSQQRDKIESRVKFVVAVPRGAAPRLREIFDENVAIVEDRAGDLLSACDAAVVKSGTVTLEAAVADAPQVVVYDGPKLLELQWRLMGGTKKTPFIAMPNIILERSAAPELLGADCRPARIVQELHQMLYNEAVRDRIKNDYREVRRNLGEELAQGATNRTADMLDELVGATIDHAADVPQAP